MFRCDKCGRISNPKERMYRLPIEYREREYVISSNRIVHGYEIAKEGCFCNYCAQYINVEVPSSFVMNRRKRKETIYEVLNKEPKYVRRLHDTQIKKGSNKKKNIPPKREDRWKDVRFSTKGLLTRNR